MKRLMIGSFLALCSSALIAGCGNSYECGDTYLAEFEVGVVALKSSEARNALILTMAHQDGEMARTEDITAGGKYTTGTRHALPASVCVHASAIGSPPWNIQFGPIDSQTKKRPVALQIAQTNTPACLTTEQIKQVFQFNPPYSCQKEEISLTF